MTEVLSFSESWLSGVVDDTALKMPVTVARNKLLGFTEDEVRQLAKDLINLIELKKEEKVAVLFDGELLNEYAIFSLVCDKKFIPWQDFLNRWPKLLFGLNDLITGIFSRIYYKELIENENNSAEIQVDRLFNRLYAILILNAASKGDLIQARDVAWQIVHSSFPEQAHLLVKKAIQDKGRQGQRVRKQTQDHEVYKLLLKEWYFKEGINCSSMKKAASVFVKKLDHIIKKDGYWPVKKDAVYRWIRDLVKES